MTKFAGCKWTALIDSYRDFRMTLKELHEAPDTSVIDQEIKRLRDLRWNWLLDQRAKKKAA